MQKRIHELKAGDQVHAYGCTFTVTEDARDSLGHRPMINHLDQNHGPSACAVAAAVCTEGEAWMIKPGTPWTFQGNYRANRLTVTN